MFVRMTADGRRHSEGNGKKIKAISCELSAISC